MISKQAKPPATKRSFTSSWGELDYLCRKIHYWLYIRHRKDGGDRYQGRLERVLRTLPHNDLAIIREEGWALLCELKGKLGEAIAHRRREIELMEHLHDEARSQRIQESARAYMLRGRDADVLRERRAILESLKEASTRLSGGPAPAHASRRRRPA